MANSFDIDELAWKHVNSHPNDKSDRHLSVMRGRWGLMRAYEAIERAENVRAMVDPAFATELPRIRLQRQHARDTKAANIAYYQQKNLQKLRRKQEQAQLKLSRHRVS